MTAALAPAPPFHPSRASDFVIARYTARRALLSAGPWSYVFGAMVASSAFSYTRIYKTAAERERLAATFGNNHAASALFGPAPQLQTVAGFTVFKVSMALMVIGAVWGLLTSTRLLRGDEDAGRWDILASGQTTRGRAVAQVVSGLGAGAAVLWAVTALVTDAAGRFSSLHISVTAGAYLALALVATAVMFLAVGALTSQLAASRRQAAAYAGVLLGASYALRMVGDAGTGLHALVWASPLGWVEQLYPLTKPNAWPLVPIGGFTAVMVLAAAWLAGQRDIGTSTWPDRNSRAARLQLLSGPTAFTLRRTSAATLWWATAIAICGLLMGIVANAAGTTIVGSSVQQVFARLGAPGTGTRAFLGVSFLIIAIVLGFQAASEMAAARAEEAEGRLDNLIGAAVSRRGWLAGRLCAGTLALGLSGISTGVLTYAGAASQESGISLASALDAGANIVPPAVFLLGFGTFVLGWWPRRATAAVYAVLGWSALIELLGGFFSQGHWLLDTSLFHQMRSAPAVAPDWQTNLALLGLGVLGMVIGTVAFRYRDLAGE